MLSQSTNHILLIKPAEFYCNEQTIETNHYQILDKKKAKKEMLQEALLEFKAFENNLKRNKIKTWALKEGSKFPKDLSLNIISSQNKYDN